MGNKKEIIQLKYEATTGFSKAFKQGIYKELHARELLTDQQLNQLLNRL
ncbi:MAG: hypothetical protein U0L05_01495 [Schaedlerella sp.]|nr:hypothetical protein [Schaedlerella sp.]